VPAPSALAAPRWSAEDWAEADRVVSRGLSVRRIEWLDGPEDRAATAGLSGLTDPSDDGPAYDTLSYDGPAYDTPSYGRTSFGSRSFDGSSFDGSSFDGSSYGGPSYDGGSFDNPRVPEDGPRTFDEPTSPAPLWTVAARNEDGGWTDEDWLERGNAPTEELFASRTVIRSHRRPEPVRKVTLRVLAAILVAGGTVGLTMNFASGHGSNQAAPVRVDDGMSQDLQRQASSDMSTAPPAPTTTEPASADSNASAPLAPAPATTRKPAAVVPPAAPPAAVPVPTTTAPTTATTAAPTTPPPPTTPPTTTPPPTTSAASSAAPVSESAAPSGSPTPAAS
jgi:hypothetical protein